MTTTLAFGDRYRHTRESEVYRRTVHPMLLQAGILPYGDLRHAEGSSQDERLGIDWTILTPNGTGLGLATRVQWDVDYGTFTIRYRTAAGNKSELTKRWRSIMQGGTYPTYTIQAYVERESGRVINAYVIRTHDLYAHCVIGVTGDDDHFRTHECVGRKTMAPGGATFLPVAITERGKVTAGTHSTLIACGVSVRMVRPEAIGMGLWTD